MKSSSALSYLMLVMTHTVGPFADAYANALGHQPDEDGKEARSHHDKLLRHRAMEDVEDYGVFKNPAIHSIVESLLDDEEEHDDRMIENEDIMDVSDSKEDSVVDMQAFELDENVTEDEDLRDVISDSDNLSYLTNAEDSQNDRLVLHDSVSPRVLTKADRLPSTWNRMKSSMPLRVFQRIRDYHPVFSYDDSCYPATAVTKSGWANNGLNSCATTGKCRQSDFMSHSNTYHRWGRFRSGSTEYEVHMYALYFEKDTAPFCQGHRHDWEAVVVTFRNGQPYRVSVSAHGEWKQKWWNYVPKHDGKKPKVVYHKGAFNTSSFRFAKKSTEHCDGDLQDIGACWTMPHIVSWDYMDQKLRDVLSTPGQYGEAVPQFTDRRHNGGTNPSFRRYVELTGINVDNQIPNLPTSSYQQLKTLGLCVGIQGKTGADKKVNGAKVQLEPCRSGWESQQWARDSAGRLVNRYAGKCLEAGDTDTLYTKAYVWDCHSGQHQQWWALNNGRYQNKKNRGRYLGVAYCGERSDYRLLELRSLETGSNQCGCAQTWNKSCPIPPTSSYQQLKTLGLCVGIQGKTGADKKVNGAKVQLEPCRSGWKSQQWARDSAGRLVNRYAGKCLEAGNTGTLYTKAYVWDCHSGQHQQWWALNNGRYQNKKYRGRYLGVAYCGERIDYRLLELRSLETGSNQCGCAQTWNKSCSTGSVFGFCNYGPDGTGATSDCSGGAEGGAWCNESGANCAKCSGRWCTSKRKRKLLRETASATESKSMTDENMNM